jgi:GDP-4-dehydro-6-deoxy-D-mannose reductase
MKILVTGGTGFVGSHLLDMLVSDNSQKNLQNEIYATRRYHLSRRDKIEHLEKNVTWLDCDITDAISVNKVFKDIKPDQCFHMAAESFVSPSWDHPNRFMDVNYHGTVNILDSIKNFAPACRILLPGSGEEYGEVSLSDLPITKNTPLRPVNPYAVTKIAQDLIGFVYFKSYNLNVIRLRTFNHEGPRRERYFGIASFCYQLAKIEKGLQDPIVKVGHIDDKRNFTHVKDIIRAYLLAMNTLDPGNLYIVGSDDDKNVATFREVLNRLISGSIYKQEIKISEASEYVRPTAVPYLIGDISEFRGLTGWAPEYSLNQILEDVMKYWRERVSTHPDL